MLDRYLGIYSISVAPVKFTITRDGATRFVQLNGPSAIPLEPTAPDKFRIENPPIVFEFDATKNRMRIIRNGRECVLTRGN
jgi:D-alanyl-D-alanine carboxypeptidase